MSPNVRTLQALADLAGSRRRIGGLDLGTKTIGVALSDVGRQIATPFKTLSRKKFTVDAAGLAEIGRTHDIAAWVIGLPLNMDGSAGPRVQATEAFVRNIAAVDPTPFVYWDERLSTAAVTRSLIEQDVSRAKRAAVVDRMAAAYILQGALDRLARLAASVQYPR